MGMHFVEPMTISSKAVCGIYTEEMTTITQDVVCKRCIKWLNAIAQHGPKILKPSSTGQLEE